MNIVKYPNPGLEQECAPVDPVTDDSLHDLANEMIELMYEAEGIGLAASQVGVMKKMVVIDVDKEKPRPMVFCNPKVVDSGEEVEMTEEGCLSFPGMDVPIERPTRVTVEAQSLKGKPVRVEAEGVLARCLQHEIDHVNGITILDRAKPEDRKEVLTKYRSSLIRPVE